MADLSQPNNLFTNPDDHLARLLAPEMDEPWYKSLVQNIKDAINPPKLPPLVLTSKPVPVKDIWGLYGRQKKSFMMSTGFQILCAVLLFTVASSKAVQDKDKLANAADVAKRGNIGCIGANNIILHLYYNYLFTYTLIQGERVTRRSTIWRRNPEGWQILFHQGTAVA